MSDVAKVRKSLSTATAAINEWLKICRGRPDSLPLDEPPSLSVLRKDFCSALSLIRSYSTRLWVALGKQPATLSAGPPTIETLLQHISSLCGCVLMIKDIHYGKAMSSEARFFAIEVLEALQSLFAGYTSKAGGDELNRKTAAVHVACDHGSKISLDNREATLRLWTQDSDALKDALKEMGQLLESDSDGLASGDGWDELLDGEGEEYEISDTERQRIKKAMSILEQILALRKRVQKGKLSPSSSTITSSVEQIDHILEAGRQTTPLLDDIVDALHPPQDPAELTPLLGLLSKAMQNLIGNFNSPREEDDLSIKLNTLKLQEEPSENLPSIDNSIVARGNDIINAIGALFSATAGHAPTA